MTDKTLQERLREYGSKTCCSERTEAADALDAQEATIAQLKEEQRSSEAILFGKIDAQAERIKALEADARAERDRHREEMNRWGCPYVSTVVSQEDGFYLAHQIISAHPSPQGLRVVIESTRARALLGEK